MRLGVLLIFFLLSFVQNIFSQGYHVQLLCNWNDTITVPRNLRGYRYNEVWGFVANGREYGIIGSSVGGHVIDIATCKQVALAKGRFEYAAHRDFKTYKHWLYAVCYEGQSTLQIYDTRYLPDSLPMVYESSPQSFRNAIKLFVDTNTAKLYAVSFSNTTTALEYMRVYSLQKPDSPSLLSIYNENGDVHDLYVRNDTAFCSSGFSGFYVVDCSTTSQTNTISLATSYPYKGYNHSSWIGQDGIGIMSDETFGMPIKVIDTRNLSRISVLSTFSPRGLDNTSVPHDTYIRGKHAFVAYYMDGLQIYDLSDPKNPTQAGYYRTYTGTPYQGYDGAWGTYPFFASRKILVSDMQNGLFVLDADEAIGHEKNFTFRLYPNPATDVIKLAVPEDITGILHYSIYDILGRKLIDAQINVSYLGFPVVDVHLQPYWQMGMYFFKAQIANKSYTATFIKQ